MDGAITRENGSAVALIEPPMLKVLMQRELLLPPAISRKGAASFAVEMAAIASPQPFRRFTRQAP
jgi:hypothetical protein